MNINSRINWQTGMELTPQVFISLDERLDFKQQTAIRIALGGRRMGLVPNTDFNNKGTFVRNTFCIDRFQCMALLPSGRMVHTDEEVSVKIPMLYGELYYLTVGIGEELVFFENEGVPFTRPKYVYEIHTMEELEQADLLPIVRFKVKDGEFSIDTEFIAPCLTLESDSRFVSYLERLVEKMEKLATHPNQEEGDGKRLFMRYFFLLKSYRLNNSLHDFILFTQEMAQAIDYYVVTPYTEHREIPQPSVWDIQVWLEWLVTYMEGAASILDGVVLEDNSIDFEALKAQIKAELYERLNPELYERLVNDLKEVLRVELTKSLSDTLTAYLNEHMKPELYSSLFVDLNKTLYDNLYQALYDALYKALYVPVKKENDFVPMI